MVHLTPVHGTKLGNFRFCKLYAKVFYEVFSVPVLNKGRFFSNSKNCSSVAVSSVAGTKFLAV